MLQKCPERADRLRRRPERAEEVLEAREAREVREGPPAGVVLHVRPQHEPRSDLELLGEAREEPAVPEAAGAEVRGGPAARALLEEQLRRVRRERADLRNVNKFLFRFSFTND